jgi:Tfp pilus assembly protein FimV
LRASVAILGASVATTPACFSLAASADSIAPLPHAELSLERSGQQTLLHIRTSKPVYDPIAQFALVFDCEGRLQRDYVVLLDPPSVSAPEIAQDAPPAVDTTAATVAAPPPPAPVRRPIRRAPVAAARPSATAPQRPAAPRAQAAASTPRLVLSGKEHAQAVPPSPELDAPDVAQPRSVEPDATDLSDENTALNRKLAYLEAQLAALQRRNAELEARQAVASTATAPPPSLQPSRWPLYLLIIGLLGAAIALVAWLLRRSRPQPLLLLEDPAWAQPDGAMQSLSEATSAMRAEPQPTQRMAEIAPPAMVETTEVKDDILDQAEVYMAHGHGELAIHLLQEHLRAAPTESPIPWFLLLDLLHREGDEAGYAVASAECRRYFNVNLGNHPISHNHEAGQGLEAYPHLLEQLVKAWNSPDIDDFFKDLIYDDRGGTRMGFEPGAYREILLLREIARATLALAA